MAEAEIGSAIPVMEPVKDIQLDATDIKVTNGKKEKEEEDDGEFIKVEKESLELKENTPYVSQPEDDKEEDDKPSLIERSSSNNSSRELIEAKEKSRELEIEIEQLAGSLKRSESENYHLKDEVLFTKQKLEETEIKFEELELNQTKLKEALQPREARDAELTELKESFHGLTLELENSRKQIDESEHQLKFSSEEARKFEELHLKSGSEAELETKRALAFERLLEVAKSSAKEMEDQMASLQEEVKGLYNKIAENEKVEEALKAAVADLSATKEELAVLKSNEGLITELTRELEISKGSESKLKEDIQALENLFAETKEDLKVKVSELEDLGHNSKQLKELCNDLEEKLGISDENFLKTDSLLSQALLNNKELEEKLKSVQQLHNETGDVAKTATERSLELEDSVRLSKEAAEEASSKLRELETRFIAVEQKNVQLEQDLNLVELKANDAERELRESLEKINELESKLRDADEERKTLNDQKQKYKEKIAKLESGLNQSLVQNSELEKELKSILGKFAEHEDRANMSHRRSIELEDLFNSSNSKVEDANKKASELELLLEAEKYRIQELEEQISTLDRKCVDSESKSKNYSDKVLEITSELEAFQARSSSLEIALNAANEKEKELIESLNIVTEEKRQLEDSLNSSNEKFSESENLVEILRNEMKETQEKLEKIESDLNSARSREEEILGKLKSAEEQLEHTGRDSDFKLQNAVARFSTRDSEANSLLEKVMILEEEVKIYEEKVVEADRKSATLKEELDQSLLNLDRLHSTNEELELKISEVQQKASQLASDHELLSGTNLQLIGKIEKLQDLLNSAHSEREVTSREIDSHKSIISDLTEKHSRAIELHSEHKTRSVKAETELEEAIGRLNQKDLEAQELNNKLREYEESLLKLKRLESVVRELQTKASLFETENTGLVERNMKLTEEVALYETKLSDFRESLSSVQIEKDETAQKLDISKKTIEDLTRQLASEGQRLQSQISTVMEENTLLNETYKNVRDELQSKILQLEGELKEEKENEDALRFEIEILKAETADKSVLQTRLKELEEQLVIYEARAKEQVESVRFAAAGREAYLTSKLEEHSQRLHGVELLNEQVLQLQKELHIAQSSIEEKNQENSRKESEREASLKESLNKIESKNIESKNKEIVLLEKQVKGLEQKLLEKGDGGSSQLEPKDGLEVKSRDIGSTVSIPAKRKHKKKKEATSPQASSSSLEIRTQTAGDSSPFTSLKFVLAVALVSAVIGVILGKRY